MKKILFTSGALMILLSSCLHSFKKASDGIEYKVISNSDKKATQGDYMELWAEEEYKDSKIDTVLQSSDQAGTDIFMLDSNRMHGSSYEIFSSLGAGDSAVIRMSTDSIFKMGRPMAFMSKGEYVIWHFKVKNVYTTEVAADSARKVHMQAMLLKDSIERAQQLVVDTKTITDYLNTNKITAVKAPLGTFVSIQKQGTGKLIDTSVEAQVIYTGMSFNGTVFDSNADTSMHRGPIPVDMWAPRTIEGWPDGLKLLSKGAKATFYIPSALAYGAHPQPGGPIHPNENLMFTIEVVDVVPRAQAEAAEKAAMQKQYIENMMRQQMQQQQQQQQSH